MMKRFDHDNIVKLLGVCTRKEPAYAIMEFMLHGTPLVTLNFKRFPPILFLCGISACGRHLHRFLVVGVG